MYPKNAAQAVLAAPNETCDGFRVYGAKPLSYWTPRTSYVPMVGEWFWLLHDHTWRRRQRVDHGTHNEEGCNVTTTSFDESWYKGKCLPAMAPTK